MIYADSKSEHCSPDLGKADIQLEDQIESESKEHIAATLESIEQLPDPLAAIRQYSNLIKDLYWKNKDIDSVVIAARAAIQYGLSTANSIEGSDAGIALEIRGITKGIAYNLGSFTWPGWDEPGIKIENLHLKAGMDAAILNRTLAEELNKGPLALSRAEWLLGAHFLAIGEYENANLHFITAVRYAMEAGKQADQECFMCTVYPVLVQLVQYPENEEYAFLYNAMLRSFSIYKKDMGYVEQLETARRVFSRKISSP